MRDPAPDPGTDLRRAAYALAADRVTAEVATALAAAGVPSMLLKGPALGRWLDGRPDARSYVDSDLLVPDPQFDAAEGVLARLGFRRAALDGARVEWDRYARTWLRADGAIVDLHRTLLGVGAPPGALWEAMAEEADRLAVAGCEVAVPGPSGLALIVALAAAKDAARHPRARHDLARALVRAPEDRWREAASLAARVGATGSFVAGLRTAPAGEALVRAMGLSGVPSVEVALRREPIPPLAAGMSWLLATRGLRRKIGVVARKVAPAPAFMRAWSPLARRSRAGLVVAYLWRLAWIARHVVPALRAARRARAIATASGSVPQMHQEDTTDAV